ncbi:hypothetical protein LZ32DRAFT_397961 [Colletotrichum eremochloae]|nr:hypothetical protein LZ32DRAFT_397961 [Colletotrichum eremochloae]
MGLYWQFTPAGEMNDICPILRPGQSGFVATWPPEDNIVRRPDLGSSAQRMQILPSVETLQQQELASQSSGRSRSPASHEDAPRSRTCSI